MKRPGSRVVGDANPYEKNGSRGEAGEVARLRAAEGVGPYGERDGVRKNAPGDMQLSRLLRKPRKRNDPGVFSPASPKTKPTRFVLERKNKPLGRSAAPQPKTEVPCGASVLERKKEPR